MWHDLASRPLLWKKVDLSFGWIRAKQNTLKWLVKERLSQCTDLNLTSWTITNDQLKVRNICIMARIDKILLLMQFTCSLNELAYEFLKFCIIDYRCMFSEIHYFTIKKKLILPDIAKLNKKNYMTPYTG